MHASSHARIVERACLLKQFSSARVIQADSVYVTRASSERCRHDTGRLPPNPEFSSTFTDPARADTNATALNLFPSGGLAGARYIVL